MILSCPKGSPTPPIDLKRVAALPQVASSFVVGNGQTNVADLDGHPLMVADNDFEVSVIAPLRAAEASRVRLKVLAGRLPVGPDEIAVSWGNPGDTPRAAVGDTVELQMLAAHQPLPHAGIGGPPASVDYRARVVGEVLTPGGLTGDSTDLWASSS